MGRRTQDPTSQDYSETLPVPRKQRAKPCYTVLMLISLRSTLEQSYLPQAQFTEGIPEGSIVT